MKRIVFWVLLSGTIGWSVGYLLQPSSSEGPLHTAMAAASKAGASDNLIHHPGDNTIELSADDSAASSGLPQEILDARAKGATARQQALQQALGQVFPKSGQWGMGGPLFPMARPVVPEPLQRPVRTAFVTTMPDPYGGPVPPSVWPFGPGNLWLPPTIIHIDSYPPSPPPYQPPVVPPGPPPGPPPVVPEPSTWLLMLLGFALLALRLRAGAEAASLSSRPDACQS